MPFQSLAGAPAVIKTIATGSCAFGVALNSTATRLYVSDQCANDLSVIDLGSDTTLATVPVRDRVL